MDFKKFKHEIESFGRNKTKRVLFLENGNCNMTDDLNLFKKLLIENKIEITILAHLQEIPIEIITDYINEYDVIVFQTTWLTEISRSLLKQQDKFKDPKTIIDIYLRDPHVYENHSNYHQWVNIKTDDTLNFENWEVEVLKPKN